MNRHKVSEDALRYANNRLVSGRIRPLCMNTLGLIEEYLQRQGVYGWRKMIDALQWRYSQRNDIVNPMAFLLGRLKAGKLSNWSSILTEDQQDSYKPKPTRIDPELLESLGLSSLGQCPTPQPDNPPTYRKVGWGNANRRAERAHRQPP